MKTGLLSLISIFWHNNVLTKLNVKRTCVLNVFFCEYFDYINLFQFNFLYYLIAETREDLQTFTSEKKQHFTINKQEVDYVDDRLDYLDKQLISIKYLFIFYIIYFILIILRILFSI